MTLSRDIAHMIMKKGVSIADVEEALRTYKLLPLFPSIKKALLAMAKETESQESIAIETPFPLDDKAVARIKRIVGNDLASHSLSINKDLLAGFKARYKGRLYDGSAKSMIRRFINH